MARTTTELLASVKRRISMPANQALLDDEDILALTDECILAYIVPALVSVRQDYFVYLQDVTLVADQAEYDIPYRALGRTLRDLKIVDSGSTLMRDMVKVDLEDAHIYSGGQTAIRPYGFHFQGDKIVIVPAPITSTLTLKVYFELPPNRLVTVGSAGQITAISGGDITVGSAPSTVTTSSATDFIAGKQGNATKAFDKTPTNVAGNIITYATTDIPSSLAVGDYIALAEESPVLQIPDECYPWLVTKVSRRSLYAISDFEGYSRLKDEDKEEETRLKKVLEPRIRGETTKILNRFSISRQGRFAGRRGILF